MKKTWMYPVLILLLASCTNELIYRSDFDSNKQAYYEACLQYEKTVQQENIEGIQAAQIKAKDLASILYHRLPEKRDQFTLLAIGLKLYRLEQAIAILEDMRQQFYSAFELTLTDSDVVDDLLQVQFNLEIRQMEDLLVHVNELKARILYLDRFRQETTLKTEIQEEKIENFGIVFANAEKTLKETIYKKMVEKFSNLGKTITKNSNFSFQVTPRTIKENLNQDSALFPSASNRNDVSGYEYYFQTEKQDFDIFYGELEKSVDRFQKAIDAYASDNKNNQQISLQLQIITTTMEDAMKRTKTLFNEVLDDIKSLVGGREVIDETLWTQVKRENQDEANYYTQSLVALSGSLRGVLAENPNSEASQAHVRILNLDKHFNQTQGLWGIGHTFLSEDWKQKTSLKGFAEDFKKAIGQVESSTKEGLRPLWTTIRLRYKGDARPPYTLKDGYLEKSD